MTIFPHLLTASGLTQQEAADFLEVRRSSVDGWARGRRICPNELLNRMIALVQAQTAMADHTLDLIDDHPDAEEVEIEFCADNYEAQGLGLPTKSAYDAVIRRVIERIDNPHKIKFNKF